MLVLLRVRRRLAAATRPSAAGSTGGGVVMGSGAVAASSSMTAAGFSGVSSALCKGGLCASNGARPGGHGKRFERAQAGAARC